jgi:hypothetical protein
MPLSARNESICCVCNINIGIGSYVRPFIRDLESESNTTCWIHYDCISESTDDPRVPLCRHFAKKGTCIYENSCSFRHPKDRVSHMSTSKGTERQRRGTWQRRKIVNGGKVGSLRRWLVNVFGVEYLSSGSGVLDVAGGKGKVSFEMLNLNGIPCTVIDPRELCLLRYQKKYARGFYHRNEVLRDQHMLPIRKETFRPPGTGGQALRITTRLPGHIRTYFHMDGIRDLCSACGVENRRALDRVEAQPQSANAESLHPESEPHGALPVFLESGEVFKASREESRLTSWTSKGLQGVSETSLPGVDNSAGKEEGDPDAASSFMYDGNEVIIENKGENEISRYEEALRTVRDCSLVVGMHADQATEHLVEFALRNNKPFAILPCCIYSKQFPTRMSSSGELVTTYAQFIEFLLAKDPLGRIRAVELDFEGKNVLLYFVPNAVCGYSAEGDKGEIISMTGGVGGAAAVGEIPAVPLLVDPVRTVPLVVRGVATRTSWQALSDGLTDADRH